MADLLLLQKTTFLKMGRISIYVRYCMCLETNLTRLRQDAAGILPLHSAALSGPCWHSPNPDSGRSHGPTPGGWSLHWLGCLCLNARCGAALPVRPSGRRKAEVTGTRHPSAHSTAGWINRQARLAPAHGQRMTLQYHRLRAKKKS